MLAKLKFDFLKYEKLFRSLYVSKKLTMWSTLASAFNSKPSRIESFKSQLLGKSTGLFGYRELQEQNGFSLLRDTAITKSNLLIEEILSEDRKRKMVQVFDELSDTLCKVADLAELVKNNHPDEKFANAAEEASLSIRNLVERLNTNRDLYDKLKDVVEHGDTIPTDAIDDFVADLFLFDFEQSGIHLDEEKRKKVVEYKYNILRFGSDFMTHIQSPRIFETSKLPKSISSCFPTKRENTFVNGLLEGSENERLRELAYRLFLCPEKKQQELLHELLSARQNLAKLCGFPSYAHQAVRGSLAGTPEFVREFLELLSEKIRPKAEEDYKDMLKLKQEYNKNATCLMPWDVPYFTEKLKEKEFNVSCNDFTPYFSLGACMDGLNYIFNAIYNINISVDETKDGELWHSDVKKLKVCEGNEILGYIYCDFFERPRKPNQDCQFTIQGGRVCNDGHYQKPIVAVMLNLPKPKVSLPPLLMHSSVENLFHEMGHAMHSMLARTIYQHVSGTRCSMDLAEIPSILMEYFASDPRVVTRFARHYKTGEPIPEALAYKLWGTKQMFSACEIQLEVFKAAFDQACHASNNACTTELSDQLQNLYYGLPVVPNTAWQLRFGHLVGYGAKYYSYLVSRAVASWIWHTCFKDNPFDSKNGGKFRNEILAYGGSKPPLELVEHFLGTKITPENLSDAFLKDISY